MNQHGLDPHMLSLPRDIISDIIADCSAYNVLIRSCRDMRALMPAAKSLADSALTRRRHVSVPRFEVVEWVLQNGTRHGILTMRHKKTAACERRIDGAVCVKYDRGAPTDWRMVVDGHTYWGRIASHITVSAPPDDGYHVTAQFNDMRVVAAIGSNHAMISGLQQGCPSKHFQTVVPNPVGFYVNGTMHIDVIAEWLARWMHSAGLTAMPIEMRQKRILPRCWMACIHHVTPQLFYTID